MKVFKNDIIKALVTTLLITGTVVFFIFLALTKTIDWINHELEPKYDSEGRMIYEDDRHTIVSFGKRKEFDIWKSGSKGEVDWILFDKDKNKGIDKIRFFTRSTSCPCVYTVGEKGYTKLNYETAEIKQSKNIKDFSKEDKLVFEKLKIEIKEAKDDQEKSEISWEWIMDK